mgnify:CR=1 FL=1
MDRIESGPMDRPAYQASGGDRRGTNTLAAARDVFGASLRFVATYDAETLAVVDWTGDRPDPTLVDRVADEMGMAVAGGDRYQADLYGDGPLEFVVHGFEAGLVVRVCRSATTGELVVADPDARSGLTRFLAAIDDP